ncbi:MAG: L-aspartate oxidase [candidate division WOR-3 bacterium]|nr:MAG: L-aspartate oxidase [candidate division WOR-3 bacterium]
MPKQVDFLVVGSGIAGLTFANKAAKYGDVLVLTKKRKADSSTNYAQGGIAAVFGEDDAPEYHIRDTIKAGEGLCHEKAVQTMVREGPALVEELHSMGCRFSMNSRGHFDLGQEGGHSRRRIVHAKDFTGQEIERVLLEETKKAGVSISENEIALDLVVQDRECQGIYYLDADTRQIDLIHASATVLATGGAGQVYNHTTNPPIATGDGIAMAYRAGAKVANMEFVQFHPTAVYSIKIDGRSFLVSEAVRGEGGVLKTKNGVTFMKKYHQSGNLAPRDIVARACLEEMHRTRSKYVLLDVSHLQADFIKNRFPTIYETCLSWGLDITREPIPVVPAAHYLCGGIYVNEWAESSIPRLFALGECSCTGVHGANRLASNSLLEALVFAKRAAKRVESVKALHASRPIKTKKTAVVGPNLLFQIKEIMDQYVGLIRSEKGLQSAKRMVDNFRCQFDDGIHIINAESRNVTVVAQLIIESALERKESRGLHFMTDYPKKKKMHCKDTIKEPVLRDAL